MLAIAFNVQLHVLTCCKCGVVFAITETDYLTRRKNERPIACANGHKNYYDPPTADADKAGEQSLIDTRRKIAMAIHEEDQRQAREAAQQEKPKRGRKPA